MRKVLLEIYFVPALVLQRTHSRSPRPKEHKRLRLHLPAIEIRSLTNST